MADTIIEIVKEILPACITGIITFWITKYTYHKNVPLDKLEIAYNRVYYPIYYLVRNEKDIYKVIEKSEFYLKRYNKYVDRSTIRALGNLKKNQEDEDAYSNYIDNIYNMNGKLRRRLGYLEPNILNMYTYSSKRDKRKIRFLIWFLCGFMAVYVYALIKIELVRIGMLVVLIFDMIAVFLELMNWGIEVVWKFGKNIYSKIKLKNVK